MRSPESPTRIFRPPPLLSMRSHLTNIAPQQADTRRPAAHGILAHVSLRIVQLSDLHLRRQLDDKRWRDFERLLIDLSAQVGSIDRIVLTGDLAAHGERPVYEGLRARIANFLPRLRVIGGNHDSQRHLRAVFDDLLLQGGPALNFVEEVQGVRLIGLDSAQPFSVGGALGRAQLDWLTEILQTPTPSLLFLHHPPVSVGSWWLDKDRLRDRVALEGVLSQRNVLGVFCGHVHQEFKGQIGTVPVWTTPSTAYQFRPRSFIPRTESVPPGFRLIEVQDGVVRTEVLRSASAHA